MTNYREKHRDISTPTESNPLTEYLRYWTSSGAEIQFVEGEHVEIAALISTRTYNETLHESELVGEQNNLRVIFRTAANLNQAIAEMEQILKKDQESSIR